MTWTPAHLELVLQDHAIEAHVVDDQDLDTRGHVSVHCSPLPSCAGSRKVKVVPVPGFGVEAHLAVEVAPSPRSFMPYVPKPRPSPFVENDRWKICCWTESGMTPGFCTWNATPSLLGLGPERDRAVLGRCLERVLDHVPEHTLQDDRIGLDDEIRRAPQGQRAAPGSLVREVEQAHVFEDARHGVRGDEQIETPLLGFA